MASAPYDSELDDAEPWAMNLVVRVERGVEVWHDDLLVAAGLATAALLYDERASTSWQETIERWNTGRIRKLCRRARGAHWEATEDLDHVEVTVGTATVRAFVPGPVSAQPSALARLQLSGTDLPRRVAPELLGEVGWSWLEVVTSPTLEMTSAKTAVQVAHGVQLVLQAVSDHEREAWLARPALHVRVASEREWAAEVREGEVVVFDAGFTEIAPNSQTVRARMRRV